MLKRFLFTLLALPFTVLIPSEMDAAPKKSPYRKNIIVKTSEILSAGSCPRECHSKKNNNGENVSSSTVGIKEFLQK